jgi:hypothetical protein
VVTDNRIPEKCGAELVVNNGAILRNRLIYVPYGDMEGTGAGTVIDCLQEIPKACVVAAHVGRYGKVKTDRAWGSVNDCRCQAQ